MPKTVIVVPCFNEAERLCLEGFEALLVIPEWSILFVNDGSTDGTRACLDAFQAKHPQTIQVLHLESNSGKAEAVRRGLVFAIETGAGITGYLDADLATPAVEFARILRILQEGKPGLQVLIGARVKLLGRDIQRSPVRHFLGRVFATAASILLRVPVYDTQCGAKAFRCTPELSSALAEPFGSRWIFDVELLGRLIHGGHGADPMPLSAIQEEPLTAWRDVKGSKLGAAGMVNAAMELLRIRRRLRSHSKAR